MVLRCVGICTYGGESPARAAPLALVLDVGDVSLVSPVDVDSRLLLGRGHVVHGADARLGHGRAVVVEPLSDLVGVEVGELVEADLEGHLSGLEATVVLGYLDGVLLEDLHAVGLLVGGCVVLAMSCLERVPVVGQLHLGGDGPASGDGHKGGEDDEALHGARKEQLSRR